MDRDPETVPPDPVEPDRHVPLLRTLSAFGAQPDRECAPGEARGAADGNRKGDPYVHNDRRNEHVPCKSQSIADMGLEVAEMVA